MRIPALAFAVLLTTCLSQGQSSDIRGSEYCALKRSKRGYLLKIDDQSAPRHAFDVVHYNLRLDLFRNFAPPFPRSFSGITTVALRAESTLTQIRLDAVNSSLIVDSVAEDGASFTHAGDLLTVNLRRVMVAGDTGWVKIFYRHKDVSDNAFFVGSDGMVFTDCEPEGARKWFPCWDRPADKATCELTAKVPATVTLGSNGRLQDSVRIADTVFYHWVSRDPIATYLVVISAKVGYGLDLVYWRRPSNSNDSLPIRFYYNAGEDVSQAKAFILPMTSYYSQMFGEHPFEKDGFATLNNDFGLGGMENQTLTSLCPRCWGENLISHEFAHQWFGDMITCGTWADIWLNEGFATYAEALWYEKTQGYSRYKTDIEADAGSYVGRDPGWPIYNPGWAQQTPSNGILFNYAVTYAKGACVLHMLRYVLGDSVFFAALRAYATDTIYFRMKNAVTAGFMERMNTYTGQNLDWFFSQWLMQPHHPLYENEFSIDPPARTVTFRTQQVQTNAGFFAMPLTLRIPFSDGTDTTFRVFNDQNAQVFLFAFLKTPTSLIFDPFNDIVLKQSKTTQVLEVGRVTSIPLRFALEQNTPNPFNPSTTIQFQVPSRDRVSLRVYDTLGKEIAVLMDRDLDAGSYSVQWSADGVSSGTYFCRLQSGPSTASRKMMVVK